MTTAGGRMDVIARSILYALHDAYEQRRDVLFIGLLNGPPKPPVALYVWRLPAYARSEFSVGELIREALSGVKVGGFEAEEAKALQIFQLVKRTHQLYLLDETGKSYKSFDFTGKKAFLLGDHIGIPRQLLDAVISILDGVISLGPKPYLTSHCIAFLNELMDRSLHQS
jgi:tRNA (pseudouridine54-N1)-methyltransferase